jgi:hypothetical protein
MLFNVFSLRSFKVISLAIMDKMVGFGYAKYLKGVVTYFLVVSVWHPMMQKTY